ncbi:MAG: DNA methyltransferase, partial [Gemmataceae bacterium]
MSLDPQLVWRGKDEQADDLEVPAVPLYIQEMIDPRAIIDNLLRDPARKPEQQELFASFGGVEDAGKRLEFYRHDQRWSNRMILGDGLLAMTSLAEKERLKGRVQMVYLDPPYGIKFGSNWQVSTRRRDVKDSKVDDLTRQPEQVKAFRDTWELGIHSYLTYLRDRLTAARELLTDSGSVFVQIGDENVHLVRCLMDEVFGSENFVSLITFKKTTGAGSFAGGTNFLSSVGDYIVWYAKKKDSAKYHQLFKDKEVGGAGSEQYTWLETPDGNRHRLDQTEATRRASEGRLFRGDNLTSQTTREAQTTVFDVDLSGKTFRPSKGGWKTNQDGMQR